MTNKEILEEFETIIERNETNLPPFVSISNYKRIMKNLCTAQFKKILDQKDKERELAFKDLKNRLRCSTCDGSGTHSTPSTYGPCSSCEGTGYSEDCCNDVIAEWQEEQKY